MASFEGSPHSVNQSSHAGITLPTIEQISGIQEQARQEG
ncbi:MAG: flagellar assembly protein FliH, partial [Marinobacter sp. 34-60-7]